jgi:glycosyltransferase involved in cell wall biosynthesis
MRVVQVTADNDRRGGPVFAVDLHAALTALGHEVRTVALVGSPRPNPLPVLGTSPRGRSTLRALLAEMEAADVAIAHGSTSLPACGLARLRTSTPFVYRNIGDPLYWANTPRRRLQTRLALGRAAGVAALWPGAARDITGTLGVPWSRVTAIPNAVPAARCPAVTAERRREARAQLGLPSGVRIALSIGSLAAEKDVPTFLRAVAANDGMFALLAGDGPLGSTLEDEAERLLPGRHRFLGGVDDPVPAYHAADVVALPSLSEGMPGCLIEAGLIGLPSVATDVGAVAEVIEDGVTGHLVPVGAPEALATAMAQACERAEAMGPAARQRCLARFEIEVVAAAWSDLIDDVAAGRPPGDRRAP